jgi:hypothetical protein
MARGDHIYVNRVGGVYNHHGIDCGDGSVIHYTSKTWRHLRRIERTSLEDFCRGDELRIRNYDEFLDALERVGQADKLMDSASRRINQLLDGLRGLKIEALDFSEDAVISRAESRIGESRFDLVSNNCEHFAAWCKTGISSSEQMNSIWKASLSGPKFVRRRTENMLTQLFESPWSR